LFIVKTYILKKCIYPSKFFKFEKYIALTHAVYNINVAYFEYIIHRNAVHVNTIRLL